MGKNEFEICIRTIIRRGNRILVCKNKKKGYYFFPGGHLEFRESIQKAILREMKEELGIKLKKFSFIGVIDNIFEEDGQKHHEINLVFDAAVDKLNDKSREDHLEFILMNLRQLAREKILPVALKKAMTKWLKNKKVFWASQIYGKSVLH